MAYRNLTDIYYLMRNNAISNKNVFHDNQFADDRTVLVLDLEAGNIKTTSKLPPEWISDVDEIQFEMTKIMKKLKELSSMHDKHLNRPTLDDNMDEENSIDLLTQEVTQILSNCQAKIRSLSIISNNSNNFKSSTTDQRLMKNIVKSLASKLQDLTANFRTSQNAYLKKIQARKERSNMLFDTSQYLASSALMAEDNIYEEDDLNLKNSRQEQLQMNRVNQQLINEREQEITHIVKSITDLNELFKDLATMVSDQGTVLDRIDFNIERVSHSVDGGLTQLEKAAKYQKSSRKMYLISILMIIFIVLFVLLVITKF